MAEPAKNAGLSLIVHLAALFLMLIVFKWNIYALVGSNIIFSLCMCYLNIRAIRLTCGYRQEIDKTYLKPLTAALVMGIVTYVVHLLFDVLIAEYFVATGLSILIAMPVYAVVVFNFGTLSKKDFTALPKGMRFTGYARNCICFRGIRKNRIASVYKAYFLLYTDAKETGYPENTWHFRFRHYKNKKKEKADTIEKRSVSLRKKRYSIGFFAAFFLIISLLAIGYQLSYQYRMDKQEAKTVEEENTQFISTKGETTKNEGYYLKELHGYVAVYLSDGRNVV
ncbi:MAG: polysaccharide biosynthesis C-terminal domain-containing protein [Lachnospiraceae bacterium]